MLKMLIFIPYGIKKVFSILLGIPAKLFLLIQVLNPLTWVRLSRKINQPATQVDENGEPIDGNDSDELRPEAPNPKLKGAWHLESEHSQKLIIN